LLLGELAARGLARLLATDVGLVEVAHSPGVSGPPPGGCPYSLMVRTYMTRQPSGTCASTASRASWYVDTTEVVRTWLIAADPDHDGRSPVELIAAGDVRAALALARTFRDS